MVVPCPGPRTISIYMVAPSPGPEPYQSIWWCLAPGPGPRTISIYMVGTSPRPRTISIYMVVLGSGPRTMSIYIPMVSLNQHETLAGSHLICSCSHLQSQKICILRQQQGGREQPTGFHRPRRGSCLAGFRGLRVSGFRGLAGFSVAGHQAKCLLNSPMPVEQ